jgi:hypothetical protein
MLRGLLIITAIIAIIIGRYAWRSHQRSERRHQATLNQYVPALNSMSADAITSSEWAYSGPLGKLTLRFEPNGKLTTTSDGTESTGRWEIKGVMLMAYIPGAEAPHEGIFRTSTDELSGISPSGLQPSTWSATRGR